MINGKDKVCFFANTLKPVTMTSNYVPRTEPLLLLPSSRTLQVTSPRSKGHTWRPEAAPVRNAKSGSDSCLCYCKATSYDTDEETGPPSVSGDAENCNGNSGDGEHPAAFTSINPILVSFVKGRFLLPIYRWEN